MRFRMLFIIWSCFFCLVANNCCVSSDNNNLANGLKKWEKSIPLPYHESLDKTVDLYASKSLSDKFLTYSPMIDSALMQRGMPLELKYLPLALSGMRSNYCQGDRYGAWQLPTLTAIRYGLTIDETQDERFDVRASTNAALDCLNDLYHHYHNWWYSILAYSNSPIELHHALILHGESLQPWDFKEQNLLSNTQVIGDFMACIYLGSEGRLKFAQIAEPAIKKVVPPTPKAKDTASASDSSKVEPSKNNIASNNNKKTNSSKDSGSSTGTNSGIQKYKIKKGDNLSKIAAKYHVKVSDLMKWNHLKNDRIREGDTLIIKTKK